LLHRDDAAARHDLMGRHPRGRAAEGDKDASEPMGPRLIAKPRRGRSVATPTLPGDTSTGPAIWSRPVEQPEERLAQTWSLGAD
jgi:hypothetical protein